jgi:hypothetical protein
MCLVRGLGRLLIYLLLNECEKVWYLFGGREVKRRGEEGSLGEKRGGVGE